MVDIQKYIKLGRRVHRYVLDRQDKGLPTVRELSRAFHISCSDVITLIEDNNDLSYNIGIRTPAGDYVEKHIGDYTVEAEKEE